MTFSAPAGQGTSRGTRPGGHVWFLLLPILTVGMATFVLPLWAWQRVRSGRQRQAQQAVVPGWPGVQPERPSVPVSEPTLLKIAGALVAGTALVFILMGLAPTDATGTATGPLSDAAVLLALVQLVVGVVLALRWRGPLFPPVVSARIAALNASMAPPAVVQAQARRQLREQYRQLARTDPALARELGVGRPDRQREVDDGGLLDFNALSAEHLAQAADLPAELAAQVIMTRQRHGALQSVDELVVYTEMPAPVAERLRPYAVFL